MLRIPCRRGGRGGFSLLEILIALIVLTVGVLGLVALFPVGIQSTTNTVKESRSAQLARSVQASITLGMRNSPDELANPSVTIQHDGFLLGQLVFVRPLITGPAGQLYFPAVSLGTDVTGDVFQTGTDVFESTVIRDIKDPVLGLGVDPTEPTQQYSFGFLVQRVGNKLFQIRVDIFRGYQFRIGWPNDHLTGNWPLLQHPDVVHSFTFLVAGN